MSAATVEAELVPIIDGLQAFIDSEIVPIEEANRDVLEGADGPWGADGSYSEAVRALLRETRCRSAKAGYYTMLAPVSVGGGGLGSTAAFLVWERIYGAYGPGRLLPYHAVGRWTSGPSHLLEYLTPALYDAVAPDLLSGEMTTCFAMSEPDAGSDAWAISTSATSLGAGRWRVTGTKQWISNSPYADAALVFAVTDGDMRSRRRGGISCFYVPMTTPGVSVDSVIKVYGEHGGNEGIVSFVDVEVGSDQLVGQLHQGFKIAMSGVSNGRIFNAGRCIGLARWALARAVGYAQERTTFGSPLMDYQGVSFPLSDSATEIYAARCLALDVARKLDGGARARMELAMAKMYCSETCYRTYDRAMQVHGAMGLTNEMKLYHGWHQARTQRVADGSAEIMRRVIVNELRRGEMPF